MYHVWVVMVVGPNTVGDKRKRQFVVPRSVREDSIEVVALLPGLER